MFFYSFPKGSKIAQCVETAYTTYAAKRTSYAFPNIFIANYAPRIAIYAPPIPALRQGAHFCPMYSEIQSAQNGPLRYLQSCCMMLGLCQIPIIAAAETGSLLLPFGYIGHSCLLLVCGLTVLLIGQAKLELQVNREGLSLRFFPYKWRWQHIGWNEMQRIRLITTDELPPGAFFGAPGHDFTHLYWLSNTEYAVLQIVLINGSTLYLTSMHPSTLMHFLEHGVHSGLLRR